MNSLFCVLYTHIAYCQDNIHTDSKIPNTNKKRQVLGIKKYKLSSSYIFYSDKKTTVVMVHKYSTSIIIHEGEEEKEKTSMISRITRGNFLLKQIASDYQLRTITLFNLHATYCRRSVWERLVLNTNTCTCDVWYIMRSAHNVLLYNTRNSM